MKLLKKLSILTMAVAVGISAVGCSSSTEEKPEVEQETTTQDDQDLEEDQETETDNLEEDKGEEESVGSETEEQTEPSVKPETEEPVAPPVKPETEKPVAPPVKPETEKPVAPPVKPETEKPVAPPVKPETEKPVAPPVKPETEKPVQPEVEEPEVNDLTAAQIYEACVAGFEPGVNFPNLIEMSGTLFTDTYGIDTNILESYKVMAPMMSGTITEIGVFHVKNAEDVESVRALVAQRLENLKNNGSMYPSHVEIVEKGQVVTKGNYVLFVADENVNTIVNNFNNAVK